MQTRTKTSTAVTDPLCHPVGEFLSMCTFRIVDFGQQYCRVIDKGAFNLPLSLFSRLLEEARILRWFENYANDTYWI